MPKIAKREFQPDYAVPPGETLGEMMEARGMTQADLARRLGSSVKHVNQVVRGSASLSPDLALGLEKVLGVSADFWLARESQFQADRVRGSEARALASDDAVAWANGFPVAELKKLDFIPDEAHGASLVDAVLRFLGIAEPSLDAELGTAYRKSLKFKSDEKALAAWLRVGEIRAQGIPCDRFSAPGFRRALSKVRTMTLRKPEEWQEDLVQLCADSGVAVVIEDTFKGARANGATRWLSPTKALLQLSLRYRWEDIFWFSFFHEAGHILLHRKRDVFVESRERDGNPEWLRLEAEANDFAARTLIPREHDERLLELELSEIEDFAEELSIAPAIVVGRLQHEGVIPWNRGQHLRRRFQFAE